MKKNTSVFVNGKLLMSEEYSLFPPIVTFKSPLNSFTYSTFANVIIVKDGLKVYEAKITQQHISTINLYSGEISE